MDTSKEALIQRLQKEGKITQDDAYLLRREEIKYNEFKQFPHAHHTNDWINVELNKRQKIAENCGCNPANGGSGVCGCVLTGPIIT